VSLAHSSTVDTTNEEKGKREEGGKKKEQGNEMDQPKGKVNTHTRTKEERWKKKRPNKSNQIEIKK